MFLENKYSRWYISIIQNAQKQARSKENSYLEAHHIIPKSLGGTNRKSNLVLLTAREHFMCHILLPKMLNHGSQEYYKMLHSAMLMKGQNALQTRYINSKLYDSLRVEYASYRSSVMKGTKHTEEHKAKISASMKGHIPSEETRKKIGQKASTRKRKPFDDAYRAKMSTLMKERHRWI